jgi:dual specificity MAP kinase phosphatase
LRTNNRSTAVLRVLTLPNGNESRSPGDNSPGMATVVVQQQSSRHSTQSSVSPTLNLNAGPKTQTSIPNKHLPVCQPGSVPRVISPVSSTRHNGGTQTSLLYPPRLFGKLSKFPPVYSIDVITLFAALDHLATQPLPDPKYVFPWLHGLHPDNRLQLTFFVNRKRSLRRIPKSFRGITIIKAGGDLSRARLKGAISPAEVLALSGTSFIEADPPEGFSVRNFHIQTAKLAPLSDIVVYGEDDVDRSGLIGLAQKFAIAQENWRLENDPTHEPHLFNTFVLSSEFVNQNRYPV